MICRKMQRSVLIETSWNVKEMSKLDQYMQGRSINRNIVECKDRRGLQLVHCIQVLIETSWNVKKLREPERWKKGIVLIETSWNVKSVENST